MNIQASVLVMLMVTVLSLTGAAFVRADSTDASCAVSSGSDAAPKATTPCVFSQRQGYVDITFGDQAISLRPDGDVAGNYTDKQGRPAYRRSGLGDKGTIFQLADRTVHVYWYRDQFSCEAAQMSRAEGCVMSYGTIGFKLRTSGQGSLNQLYITPSGLQIRNDAIVTEIDGVAYKAELADLDSDGWPEVYVYISSAGSGSYGSLSAYAVNAGKSLTSIHLPDMDDVASVGYQGHDEFAVVEKRLARRFPLYGEGDTNAAPGGGTRQLQYRLTPGESGWQLVVDRIVEY